MATAGAPVAHAPVPSQSQSGVNFTIAYDDSDMRTEVVDAADDPGASSAPPSASRRRDEPEPAEPLDAPPSARCTPVTSSALVGLRADVLTAAEGAMRGDEVAAVSAMVAATETAALREALGGAGVGTAAVSQGETCAVATAFVFGARRRLGLEVGKMDAPEVFGRGILVSRSEATEAPSSWPGSASALAALGYSEAGWESAGKSTAAENTATEPENEWRAPGDVASQPATSRAARPGDEPTPSNADVAVDHAVTREDDDDPASEREDDEDEDEDPGDWATGGTQIETVPTEDASDDDAGADRAATPEEDVGGTQIAPEEEDGDVPKRPSPAPSPRPSPAPSRSPVGPPPSFLRLASKPATTLPRRLSLETPAAETPGSLWTAAAASAGFKTPPGPGAAHADGASAKVAVAATSPFPLSAPAAKADKAEVVSETAAAPSESEKTAPRETATKPVEPVPPPSGGPSVLSDPSGRANPRAERAETSVPPTFPGGTPAEVMCSYIPSTFPQSKAPTLTESSAGGEAAPVEAVAAAAAAAEEEEEVPLSEVPLSVAMSPGAKPLGATSGALAAAMRARRRRHELAAAGASMSLGPPADDAEPPPPARADARASAFASRPEAPSGPSPGPRATSVPEASQPERSVASHASRMVVEATPGDAFTPFDLTVADDDDGAGGVGPSWDAQTRPDDVAETRRRSENPAESDPGSASLDPGGADGKGWAGGWGRVAGARRGDRAAPPRDAGGVNRREDPTQESPEDEEEDVQASPDFCLMLSQKVRDVVAEAAAEAPSQSMAPPPPRRPSSSAAGAPKPRRQSSIAAQARMQRLWDEKEARDAAGAAARRSKRRRKPRTFFGDSQFPSQSQGDEEEEDAEEDDDAVEDSDEDEEDLSDLSEDDSEEEKSEGETGTTPLAKRRAPRLRKPRKFFGDSQFPSQSQGDEEEEDAEEDDDADEGEEDDDEALEICESDEDEAPWYVGGTQAVPDVPGDADDDEDDEDAPLPPMPDDDEADDEEEADASVLPLPAKRARRASARVAAAPKPAAKKTPTKSKTPAKRFAKKNPEWRGPLPKLGCPKCRHAAKGCGRCRAIRAHAEFGTPLPWRAKTVGGARGAPSSAPPAARGGRRVRFDDEPEKSDGRASGSAGAKRRRVSASAAARSSLSSMGASVAPSRRASASSARNALSANANALALAAGRTEGNEGKVSPASRRRFRRVSKLFEGSTFLLSGIPSKGEVDELTELLETHGGVVRRDVPPPAPRFALASADLYQPSQDVGAPMRRAESPGSNTVVLTPAAGRTLKCLYAAAVGAPLVSPDWVFDCVDAGEALGIEPYRMSHVNSAAAGVDGDDEDDELYNAPRMGGVFDGVVVSLSGDANYVKQFGVLLKHAGADVVDAADLIAAEGQDVTIGEGPCDYVLVQTLSSGAKRKGPEGGLARASKRLGVPRVRHEWAVDSLLANRLKDADETYRIA